MGEDVGVFVWESREKKNDHVTSLIRPPGLMYAAGQKNGHSGSALSPPHPFFSRAFSFSDLYALRGSAHRRNFGALRQRGDKHRWTRYISLSRYSNYHDNIVISVSSNPGAVSASLWSEKDISEGSLRSSFSLWPPQNSHKRGACISRQQSFLTLSRNARVACLNELSNTMLQTFCVQSEVYKNTSRFVLLTGHRKFDYRPTFQIKSSGEMTAYAFLFIYLFLTDHVWNIKVIFTYMRISAGKQISAWHRISDLIFSACRCLGCLARSLLPSWVVLFLRWGFEVCDFHPSLLPPLFINLILPVPVCVIH